MLDVMGLPQESRAEVSLETTRAVYRNRPGHDHSARKACIGSMDAARGAGSAEAPTASSTTATAANTITAGSKGLTPNSIDRSSPDAATAPATPIAQPTAAS